MSYKALADAIEMMNDGVDALGKRMDAMKTNTTKPSLEDLLKNANKPLRVCFQVSAKSVFEKEKLATGEPRVERRMTTVYGVNTPEEAKAKAMQQFAAAGHSDVKIIGVRKAYD
jgi:hypothetical protein